MAKIPSPQEIIYSGICNGDSDTVEYFHCTLAKNVESVFDIGVRLGTGENFSLVDHSVGRIFLAIGYDEAVQWKKMLEDHTGEPAAILQVHLKPSQVKSLETDHYSHADGMVCSVFLITPISPNQVSLVEGAFIKRRRLKELNLDLDVGDIVLTGKWKNKRETVKSLGTDDLGQPTVNGKGLLTLRIEKDLPAEKQSRQTRDEQEANKQKLDEEAQASLGASGLRYKRLRLASPVIWAASVRRAKLVLELVKKNKHLVSGLVPYMRLLAKEASEATIAEPSLQNVKDAIDANALDKASREKSYAIYTRLQNLHRLFSVSRHRTKAK